jgi:transcriptional regulator with XRE-family HTH domain
MGCPWFFRGQIYFLIGVSMVSFVDFTLLRENKNDIGDRIKRARNVLKLSRIELCKMSGISPNTLISIENGKQFPSGDQILGLSGALELSPNLILCGREAPFSKDDSNLGVLDLDNPLTTKNILSAVRLVLAYGLLDTEYQALVFDHLFKIAGLSLKGDSLKMFNQLKDDGFLSEDDIDVFVEVGKTLIQGAKV